MTALVLDGLVDVPRGDSVAACWCLACRAVRHPVDAALDCVWCPETPYDVVCPGCRHLAVDHDRTGCRVPTGEPWRSGPGQVSVDLCPCDETGPLP